MEMQKQTTKDATNMSHNIICEWWRS
jgi:hypothetical protein